MGQEAAVKRDKTATRTIKPNVATRTTIKKEYRDNPPAPKKEFVDLYYRMVLGRELDERFRKLFRQGRFEGTYFSGVGQECSTVVPAFLLRKEDFVGTSHRDLGVAVGKRLPLEIITSQVFARKDSPDGGRVHPCHYGHADWHYMTPATPVAMNLMTATGAALAFKQQGKDHVAMAFFGDGATSKADFHEACNFAGVWGLPIVYICQNNFWAESIPVHLQTACSPLSKRAEAYGFPGVTIDGMDAVEAYATCKKAIERARKGGGPTLIEMECYRTYGHSDIDPADYRTDEELEYWKKRDPIPRFEKYLLKINYLTEKKGDEIRKQVQEEITEAVETAEKSPRPDPEDIFTHLYVSIEENGYYER